jgi:HAD superfamily hydrolase (TIGR01549 family)
MSSIVLPNTQINNIKMIIFDKDGTLIDVHHYWCSMIEFRAEFFLKSLESKNIDEEQLYNDLVSNMGINLETKKMKPEGPVGIKPRNFIVDVALSTIQKYDKTYTKDIVEDIFKKVDEYSKTKLKIIVKALPDVKRILNDLSEANIKIAIATTDLSTRAVLAMQSLKIDEYFIDIVGADLVKNAKPSSDLVQYILSKNNLSEKDVIVIGDSMADLGMAKNSKCNFIGVRSGLCTDEFIEQSENIIDDLTQLKVRI